MLNDQTIVLNLVPGEVPPMAYVTQDDVGRTIRLELIDGDAAFSLSPSYTYSLRGTKPSGTGFAYDNIVTVSGSNTLTFKTNSVMTAVEGRVRCGIIIYDGDEHVETLNFILQVQRAALSSKDIIDASDFDKIVENAVGDQIETLVDEQTSDLDERIADLETAVADIDVSIAPDDLGLIQDPDTGFVYPTFRGEASENGIYVSGGGSGGGGSANDAVLTVANTTGWLAATVSQPQCTLSVNWSSKLDDNTPTGDGTLTIRINNIQKLSRTVSQGNTSVNIGSYLILGTNNVKLTISDAFGNSRTIIFTVNYLSYVISSTFNGTLIFTTGITYHYVATGSGNKIVHFILDGTEIGTELVSSSGRQSNYYLGVLANGSHTLEVYFTVTLNEQIVESNRLFYDLIYADSSASSVIIASAYNDFSVQQFATCVIPFVVYTPGSDTSDVTLAVNGTTVSTLTAVDRTEHYWSYKATTAGTITLTISSGGTTKTLTLSVTESDIDAHAETQNLSLYLSSTGRSNSETNPETWTYETINASLTNFLFDTDGWQLDEDGNACLRVRGNARVNIPYQIFATDFKDNGKTIEFEFTTRDTIDPDTAIISCISGGIGLTITPQLATISSKLTSLSTRFKEDEHVRISFVVNQAGNSRLLFCYINGIASGCLQYDEIDEFDQEIPVNITIGSNDATVDIYTIRVYDFELTRYQILNNWIADTQDVDEMLDRYNRNDIYDEYDEIVISKLPSDLPYMVIYGPSLPAYKNDKKTVSIEFEDPTGAHPSFTAENVQIDGQGTSSAGYARKNFKCKFKGGFTYFDGSTSSGYQMTQNSIATSTFTFKADVASSEGANNVELVRLYNDYSPYKTEPQKTNSMIRQGIDGFPMVIFHNNGTTTKFVGKYNFNNDKGTEEVYGFSSGDESWEIKNNTDAIALFQSNDFSNWTNTFEGRYPDGNTVITNLQAFVSWVASTDRGKDDIAYYARYTEGTIDASGVEASSDTEYRSNFLKITSGRSYLTEYGTDVVDLSVVEYSIAEGVTTFVAKTQVTDGSSFIPNASTTHVRLCVTASSSEYAKGLRLHEPYVQLASEDIIDNHTHDTPEYRLAKFAAQIDNYANREALEFYYVFTELFLLMDSRAKNAFPSFFSDNKWLILPYDMDTAIGINNEGKLAFGPYLEDTDQVNGVDVYNGQQSVLWNNLRDCFFDEIASVYNSVRVAGLSYATVETRFEEHQSKWPEAIFNEDAYYKYIEPLTNPDPGVAPNKSYLGMLLGSKQEQRKWWLYNRFQYIDNKYEANAITMTSNLISFRANAVANLVLTPAHDTYLVVKYGSQQVQRKALKDVPTVMECTLTNLGDTESYIYGCENVKSLGDMIGLNVSEITLGAATNLQYLKLGDQTLQNTALLELDLEVCKKLKYVDLRNCINLAGVINVSNCFGLEEIYLTGTQVTAVNLPRGGILKKIHLPEIVSLTIINQPDITEFVYDGSYSSIRTLRVENCSDVIPVMDILEAMPAGGRVRIVGFNETVSTFGEAEAIVNIFDSMKGLDAAGANQETASISGTLTVNAGVWQIWLDTVNERYPGLTIVSTGVISDVQRFLQGTLRHWYDTTTESIHWKAFDGQTSLNYVKTAATNVSTYAFNNCRLITADFTSDDPVTIGNNAFDQSSGAGSWNTVAIPSNTFQHLILRSSSVCPIGTNVFNNSAMAAGYGAVYIPRSLYEHLGDGSQYDYKSATNWSALSYLHYYPIDQYPVTDHSTITDSWDTIIENINNGTYSTKYHVGDTKLLTFVADPSWGNSSSENYFPIYMKIVAMDTDELADTSGTAAISWLSVQLLRNRSMNSSAVNTGGWQSSACRAWLRDTLYQRLPTGIQNAIKEVKKDSYVYDGTTSNLESGNDTVWIPSYNEVFLSGGKYYGAYELQGRYYREFYNWTSIYNCPSAWWLRDTGGNTTQFRTCRASDGNCIYYNANSSYGVALGFCT